MVATVVAVVATDNLALGVGLGVREIRDARQGRHGIVQPVALRHRSLTGPASQCIVDSHAPLSVVPLACMA